MYLDSYKLRELAIELLDDEHGITQDAWAVLHEALERDEHNDIISAVDGNSGRVYLPSDHGIEP